MKPPVDHGPGRKAWGGFERRRARSVRVGQRSRLPVTVASSDLVPSAER
jgi:hypothetical protein